MTSMDNKQSYLRQYIVAFTLTLITGAAGTVVGWTSSALHHLQAEDSYIPITSADGSWIASIMMLVSVASVLPAAYMAERYGRKSTLLVAAVPYIIGWLIIAFATSTLELYVSRVISGLGYGIAYTVAPMYLGEIASDSIRGALNCMITMMNKFGILFQYCIGPYVSIATTAYVSLLFPVLFALTFVWQPETPYYRVSRGDTAEAERTLQTLLRRSDVKQELKNVEELIAEQMKNKGKWSDLITISGNRKALFIIIAVFATQQLCGSAAIIAYSTEIFVEADGSLGPNQSSIVLGSVQFLTAALSVVLVDRLGRKPLLLTSAVGVTIANAVMGAYFNFKDVDPSSVLDFGWMPIVTILFFIVSYTIGLSTVPFALTSEMFPANIKPKATAVIQMFTGFMTFAVQKSYQLIADAYGTHVIFWCFAVCSVFGSLFILFKLPETKGQSFLTIQNKLNAVEPEPPC